jgi:hypothetical protein
MFANLHLYEGELVNEQRQRVELFVFPTGLSLKETGWSLSQDL